MRALAFVQKILAWRLFSRRIEGGGILEIIKWWELRRIPYNLAVGTAGLFTVIVTVAVAAIASEKFGEPLALPDPPIIAVFAVIGYGIGANICFTGGWVVEILARKIWPERVGAFAQIPRWESWLFVANDGKHVVAGYSGMNLIPIGYDEQLVVFTFWREGKKIREVTLKEFSVGKSPPRRTASHFNWGWIEKIDSDGLLVVHDSDHNKKYRFSLETGLQIPEEPKSVFQRTR